MGEVFRGFRRLDGRVGVRNTVVVLSAMDNTNPSAERIASMVQGTTALTTPFGRGQIGADFEVTKRTLAGIAGHPNVAAVVVLSLSLASGKDVADRISATGKPVEVLGLQECGSAVALTMEGVKITRGLRNRASARRTQRTHRRGGVRRFRYDFRSRFQPRGRSLRRSSGRRWRHHHSFRAG